MMLRASLFPVLLQKVNEVGKKRSTQKIQRTKSDVICVWAKSQEISSGVWVELSQKCILFEFVLDQAGLVKTCPFSLKTCELMYKRAIAGQMGTRGGFGLLGVTGIAPLDHLRLALACPQGLGQPGRSIPENGALAFLWKLILFGFFFSLFESEFYFFFKGSWVWCW